MKLDRNFTKPLGWLHQLIRTIRFAFRYIIQFNFYTGLAHEYITNEPGLKKTARFGASTGSLNDNVDYDYVVNTWLFWTSKFPT